MSWTADFTSTRKPRSGPPTQHVMPIRVGEIVGWRGSVVIFGEIMTMPRLPKISAAETTGLVQTGLAEGLF